MKNDQALQTHLKSDRFPAGGGVPVRQDRRLPDQLRLRRPGQETETRMDNALMMLERLRELFPT